ncbi:hypothetical protein ABT039_08440 [Streptomyces lasiicapitis]|uniref:hypothetical protein n=1 Tax=Streptomyces lasiicapitis TaxID=1923961 RepID=UPI00332E400D
MKIAKAAAGVVGVALAVGAVSPAVAAPEPRGTDKQLVDDDRLSTKALKNPIEDLGVAATVRPLAKTADRLEAGRITTTHVTGAATTLSKVADVAGLH